MIGKVLNKQKQEKPLEEDGGKAPGVRLSLWSYKSKLLTPKPKPNPTFFQKADILFKAINRKNISGKRYSLSIQDCTRLTAANGMLFSILLTEYSVMFPAEQLFFLFIALRLMLNPKG